MATYSGAAYPCVPITWVDTWVLSPVGPAFANPKSDNFELNSCIPKWNCQWKWKWRAHWQKIILVNSLCQSKTWVARCVHTPSRRMLDALKSLYMTCCSASCKNESPLAAPIATLILVAQDSGWGPPGKQKRKQLELKKEKFHPRCDVDA